MRIFNILVLLFICAINAVAQTSFCGSHPKHEVRAVWLTTIGGIDWPHSYAQSNRSIAKQKAELTAILDRLQATGINTVLLQTRIRGTVIYPSAIEPWDGCLSGKPGTSPGYDALQFAIDECHKRGMELHAWVVTMPVGKWNGLGCRTLRGKMPNDILHIKTDGYMNPASVQTANYLARLCTEIASQYDVDGIHLDYIRYPEELPKLKTLPKDVGRENITRIVRQISQAVKSIKPWVKMSCSPIGKYDDTSRYWSHGWNAYNTVCQDAVGWLRDGLMDELFPMMYFRDNNFFPFALDWKEQSHGRIIVPGLGIYFMSPREKDWPLSDITRELDFLRQNGLGHAYFRSKFFTDDTKGIYRFAKNDYCLYPSLVPPMSWLKRESPNRPCQMSRVHATDGSDILSWQHANADTTQMLFNVYSSTEWPVDVNDARNLMAVRLQNRSLRIPRLQNRFYAITAIDRYGYESKPLQENGELSTTSTSATSCVAMLECDGKRLIVPKSAKLANGNFLVVESLQGNIINTIDYTGHQTSVDVMFLPNGTYWLRSLGKKGTTHRLGMFVVKR